jgi:hypothetical protein
VYFFSSHKKSVFLLAKKREKEISCYDTCFSARSPDIYTRSGGSSGGWWWCWGGVLQPPYHPRSHGNPFKFSIEILRRKEEEEGERKKKRKESPLTLNPIHMTFGSSCPLRF